MSRLNPHSVPFPSSPHPSTTTSSWSSSSPPQPSSGTNSQTTVSAGEPFPYAVGMPPPPPPQPTAVKAFGYGWQSSTVGAGVGRISTTSLAPLAPPPPPTIIQARSPSAPNLTTLPNAGGGGGARGSVPFPRAMAQYPSTPNSIHNWRAGVQHTQTVHEEEEGEIDVFHAFPAPPPIASGGGAGLSASRSVPVFPHRSAPVPASPTLAYSSNSSSRNIYIPELPPHFREQQLEQVAAQYGQVMSIKVDISPSGLCSRAFVMFQDIDSAHQFYRSLKRKGTPCEYAKEDYATVHKSLEDPTSANLYIQGFLPEDTLERFWPPERSFLPLDRPTLKVDREVATKLKHSRLQSRPQADEAIARLNDKWKHPTTGHKLQVRIADSEAQKEYKRRNDRERADKSPSMPDIRYGGSKMLNLQYPSSAEMSRQTSYASLRSPASAHFTFNAMPPSPSTSMSLSRPRLSHKPSTLSISTGNHQWTSREHWSPGHAGPYEHDQGQGEDDHEGGGFPYIDPDTVRF